MNAYNSRWNWTSIHRFGRSLGMGAAVGALIVGVAGCAGAGAGADAGGSAGGSGAAADAKAAAARGASQAVLKRPTKIMLDTPIKGDIPRGKTIAYLQCGAPACVALSKPFKQGAEVLGWKVDVIDAGLTPESTQAAWDQVVRTQPDAVFYSGSPRAFFNEQLKAVAAKGTPVVGFAITDPAKDGITAALFDQRANNEWGRLQADWIIADSHGKANVVEFPASEFEVQMAEADAFKAELKKNCPSCGYERVPVKAADVGTKIPAQIANYLQAHPDVNYVKIGFDDLLTGVPSALTAAGVSDRVKIVGQVPSTTTLAYLHDGQMTATFNNPGPEIMWRALDVFARSFTNEPLPDTEGDFTNWLVTKSNAGDLPTAPYPNVADYEAQYKALWKK